MSAKAINSPADAAACAQQIAKSLEALGAAGLAAVQALAAIPIPIQSGVIERRFLLTSGQEGAAIRLTDGRLVQAWAMDRQAPGAAVAVVHLGGGEWGVLGPAEDAA